jgi:hypothetical protein
MSHDRSHWVPIGLVLAALSSIVLGAVALSGYGVPSVGDFEVASSSLTMNLLVIFGALTLLGLDLMRTRLRPVRARRHPSRTDNKA